MIFSSRKLADDARADAALIMRYMHLLDGPERVQAQGEVLELLRYANVHTREQLKQPRGGLR